jgi:tRNA-splicing ligase RtcB
MLKPIGPYRFLLPKSFKAGMKIEGLVYADDVLLKQIEHDQTLEQIANVATLPGLIGRSLAMPDAHQGYGFCIGGVAASDPEHGIVSAGGVGFDINCGVRLLVSPLRGDEIRNRLEEILRMLFQDIPCGAGRKGSLKISPDELDDILSRGASWAVSHGYGLENDIARIEDCGRLADADPDCVSHRAKERGILQLGTLGSGNHFLEIQIVDKVFDEGLAARFGLVADHVVVLLHSGSRGLGHQVCTDYLQVMQEAMKRYSITVTDRQLACVPVSSPEGQTYLKAMAAAANFAFTNRQIITHRVRAAFGRIFGNVSLSILYDVCHNIAKMEEHEVGEVRKKLLVHRKGATRAFPAGHSSLPPEVRDTGQPVLIPGSMGTSSYVLVGTDVAMKETFGSCCHGAGRAMSRTQAKRETTAEDLLRQMRGRNIVVRGETNAGLVEEKPDAYKDIDRVVDVVHGAGIAIKVARLRPLAVMKG